MPLELKLRGKSTTQSHRTPIYYVDLVIKDGMSLQEAVAEAKEKPGRLRRRALDRRPWMRLQRRDLEMRCLSMKRRR